MAGGQGGFLNGNRFRSDVEIYSSTSVKNIPSNIANFPYNVERPIAFWYKGNVLACGGNIKFTTSIFITITIQ